MHKGVKLFEKLPVFVVSTVNSNNLVTYFVDYRCIVLLLTAGLLIRLALDGWSLLSDVIHHELNQTGTYRWFNCRL